MNVPYYIVYRVNGKRDRAQVKMMTVDGLVAKLSFESEANKLKSGSLHLVKIEKMERLNFAAGTVQRKRK